MERLHPGRGKYPGAGSGVLGVRHTGTTRYPPSGTGVTVPTGERHRFWNAAHGGSIRSERSGPPDTEPFTYVTWRLARDYPATASEIRLDPF